MKRLQTKTFSVLMTFVALVWMQKVAAQTFEYPVYEDDSVRIEVKSQGARPTIADFATACLNHSKEMEFFDKVYEDWKLYQQKKPLRHHGHFIVDIKNGFMSYEMPGEDANDTTYLEMCFWNCADAKHKLVCTNVRLKMGEDYGWSEYVGCRFYLYDNDKKTMRVLLPEDIGTLYDGNCLSVFFLPRKGKNIRVSISSEDERWDEVLEWDGYKFKEKM